jgi:predicted signal transduction protein with EAL and GGDEF domain
MPRRGRDAESLLKSANMALHKAKAEGGGTFKFFERVIDDRMKLRRALELDLGVALDNGELELQYQPIVNLQTDMISGCEALLRWNHPSRGLISPAQFIPLAEATGLVAKIGAWVMRTACAEAVNVNRLADLTPYRRPILTPLDAGFWR